MAEQFDQIFVNFKVTMSNSVTKANYLVPMKLRVLFRKRITEMGYFFSNCQ